MEQLYPWASSAERQLWFLFCFLIPRVCMNDFSANFVLISNVTGNGAITWELRSRHSVSILVPAPVCWASRPQLSLIPAVSVCLQQTCCASRCVKTPLRAEPDLNKGELWTSIFQEHFMFYLSRCCFRNHFPSCRAQKQEWRDASIYLTCCLSTKEGAKVVVLKWHGYSHSVADGLSLTYGINADDV